MPRQCLLFPLPSPGERFDLDLDGAVPQADAGQGSADIPRGAWGEKKDYCHDVA